MFSPNPPKDTWTAEESGRGGEGATGEIAWVPGRRTVFIAAQGPLWPSAGAAMRGMAREYAAGNSLGPGWRESAGIFGCPVGGSPTVPSGREWNGSQPGQGAAELLSPRPAIRKMQGQPACRAGEPSGQGEEPPPEGLGGGYPLAQTDASRLARLWAITWTASQAPLAAKSAGRHVVQSDTVLEVAYRILDLVAASASSSSNLVGDEA